MSLPSVYTQAYGQLNDFFEKIKEGQAPVSFTQQHLKDIGFASSNHRSFIPILKALDFLSSSGEPTSRYHAYRDKSQSRIVMGEAIKETYSDLFLIKSHPKEVDKELIEGKFKSSHNAKDRAAELMTKTFFSLLSLADIDHSTAPSKKKEDLNTEIKGPEATGFPKEFNSTASNVPVRPSLHYNIQIHLPATKDIEVYNSIFKSLKEHLIE